ncbi:hypothetical protein QZM93_27545, partial [Burkholderia cepacia]|nr:hypothetical protein [Burkholderia cepacia]
EEAMEEAIERFVGSSTGEALKCVLHAQKQIRTLLVTPVEQHEAAPPTTWTCQYCELPVPLGQECVCNRALSKRAASNAQHEGAPADAENFACYLIDKCERETVTEENVQAWLGAMLRDPQYATTQPAPSAPLEGTGNGAEDWTAFDWLRTEISAIDCWYRGDPSYEHDAYWMKERALNLVNEAEKLYRSPRTEVAGGVPPENKTEPSDVFVRSYARQNVMHALRWIQSASPAHGILTHLIEYFDRSHTPSADAAAAPVDVTCARMGHGVVSIADCFNPELQEPGLIFMELPEPREIGLDTGDVFPEGARAPADKTLAYVSFANGAAVDQTIAVLQRIKVKHFGAAPADEPSELEQVVACLGDDAATLRHSDEYVEMADNMEAAARLLESLAEDRAADEMCNRWPWQRGTSQPAAAAGQEAEPAAEIVRERFAGRDHWDVKIFDRTIKHGTKLYTAPPAQVATRQGLTEIEYEKVRLGLHAAKHFIANGIELGFIRMPDADCPDPAHDTPKLIDEALAILAILATQQPEPRDEVKPRKVERDSDMSVLVVFCSTREASVFEKEIRARAGEGHADQA